MAMRSDSTPDWVFVGPPRAEHRQTMTVRKARRSEIDSQTCRIPLQHLYSMRQRRSTKQQLFLFPKLDFLAEQLRIPGVFRQKCDDRSGVFSFLRNHFVADIP